MQFFSEFFSVLKCLRDQRNHHYLMAITRKNTEHKKLNADMQRYANYLTPYAFKFVNEQYLLSSSVNVIDQKSNDEYRMSSAKQAEKPHTVSTAICDCSFFTRMKLPCKHIFQLRITLDVPLFCESLINKRWSMEYYHSVERFPNIPIVASEPEIEFKVTLLQEQKPSKAKVLSQSQKFNKGLKLAQDIASLVSEGGMKTFLERYEVLQSIVSSWQQGQEVVVNARSEHKNNEDEHPHNKHDN